MPVHPDTPAPLKTALESMERQVQAFKKSLPFTPPELMDERYIELQVGIANSMTAMYNTLTQEV